jgi:hypothetical protein
MIQELINQIAAEIIQVGFKHGKKMTDGDPAKGIFYPYVLPFSTPDLVFWSTAKEHYASLMLTYNPHDSRRIVFHTFAFGGGSNRVEMPTDVTIEELTTILNRVKSWTE